MSFKSRFSLVLSGVAVLAFLAMPTLAAAGQNGNMGHSKMMNHQKMMAETSITGEVIGSHCYLVHGAAATGAGHKNCAIKCAKAGIPLAILQDGTNRVIWVQPEHDAKSANDMLMPYVAKKVTVTGHWVKRGGAEAFFIRSVKAAGSGSSMM